MNCDLIHNIIKYQKYLISLFPIKDKISHHQTDDNLKELHKYIIQFIENINTNEKEENINARNHLIGNIIENYFTKFLNYEEKMIIRDILIKLSKIN
jgi:hypothetical protein